MLPQPKWMGRPFKHDRRDIVNAILYVVRSSCAWRYLPDFPLRQTVYGHFKHFNERGTTERILDELRSRARSPAPTDKDPVPPHRTRQATEPLHTELLLDIRRAAHICTGINKSRCEAFT